MKIKRYTSCRKCGQDRCWENPTPEEFSIKRVGIFCLIAGLTLGLTIGLLLNDAKKNAKDRDAMIEAFIKKAIE